MTMDRNDPRTVVDKATEAVRDATGAVQATSESIASAINESRRPGDVLGQLTRLTRQGPLSSLAIAFVAGLIFGRRR